MLCCVGALEQMQTVSEEESWAVFLGLLSLAKRSLLRKHQHLSGLQEQLSRSVCVCHLRISSLSFSPCTRRSFRLPWQRGSS